MQACGPHLSFISRSVTGPANLLGLGAPDQGADPGSNGPLGPLVERSIQQNLLSKSITIKKDQLDTILALPKLPYASPRRNKLMLLPAGQVVHN
jgi:hypothetical protein